MWPDTDHHVRGVCSLEYLTVPTPRLVTALQHRPNMTAQATRRSFGEPMRSLNVRPGREEE
jgi:hypothetical protein